MIRLLLTWALALSWFPLALASFAASAVGQPTIGFGMALTTIMWLLKLGDMFDIFERKVV